MNSNVIYRPCVYMQVSGNQEANISAGHLSSIRTRPTFSNNLGCGAQSYQHHFC